MTSPGPTSQDRRALIDTSAFFALIDNRDDNHKEARAISKRLAIESWDLFTTNFVLAEVHALTLSRLGRSVALRALTEIERSPSTNVIRAPIAVEEEARAILATYSDKDFSLTDAISFSIMERWGISSAFTFDRNFTQYGFVPLRPEMSEQPA